MVAALIGALAGLLEAWLSAATTRSPGTFGELFGYAVLIDAAAFGALGVLTGLVVAGLARARWWASAPAWAVAITAAEGCLLAGALVVLRSEQVAGPEITPTAHRATPGPAIILLAAGGLALLVAAILAPWGGSTRRARLFARRLAPAALAALVGISMVGVVRDLSAHGFTASAPTKPATVGQQPLAGTPTGRVAPSADLAAAEPTAVAAPHASRPAATPATVSQPGAVPAAASAPALPNVLFVTIDSVRADHLGAYGYAEARTPTLDRLAAAGILFTRAYTNRNGTTPAHAGLFTGSYPSTHGVRSHMFDLLAPGVTTLAEVFAAGGYLTAGMFSWLAFEPAYSGLDRGFQVYTDLTVNLPHYLADPRTSALAATYKRLKTVLALPATLDAHLAFSADIEEVMDGKADVTTDAAILWLEDYRATAQASGQPFFLWIHYWDAHYPFTPPSPFDQIASDGCDDCPDGGIRTIRLIQSGAQLSETQTRHVLRYYDGEIAFLDQEIGRLLAAMDGMRLSQNTVVVVVGDHGESFGDLGRRLHGHDLLQSEIHIPLIMRFPDEQLSGKRVDAVVRSIDVMPTLLDYLGMVAPPTVEGRSLLPLIRGEDDGQGSYAVAELADRSIVTIVTRDWQLLKNLVDGSTRLYRVGPEGGQEDLAAIQPEVAAELERELARWQTTHP